MLLRNLVNGFVIDGGSSEGLAAAMSLLGSDEALWRAMSAASLERAWLDDAERLANAVELLLDPATEPALGQMRQFVVAMGPRPEKGQV